jgi:hypothetical protein
MSIVSKIKVSKKILKSIPEIIPASHKTIGLDEEVLEAKRLFDLLENPDLLNQRH